MSTYPNTPDTLAIGQAIVSFAQALTYPDTSHVYTLVQLSEIKDLTDLIATNGTACLEVYGNLDNSQHKGFGGKVSDEQTWFLLSITNLNDAQLAEQTIFKTRDALVIPFQTHATLGNAGSVYHAQIRPGGGKFIKIFRNGASYRAHLIEIMTKQEWLVITPPGVIS